MPKKVIPFGDRILVKRQQVGDKIGKEGIILTADKTKESSTDIAEVMYVPDHTFTDQKLLDEAENIINGLAKKANEGDSDSIISLIRFNDFLKTKSVRVGDIIMLDKYVGTDFNTSDSQELLTMVQSSDIMGLVIDE